MRPALPSDRQTDDLATERRRSGLEARTHGGDQGVFARRAPSTNSRSNHSEPVTTSLTGTPPAAENELLQPNAGLEDWLASLPRRLQSSISPQNVRN